MANPSHGGSARSQTFLCRPDENTSRGTRRCIFSFISSYGFAHSCHAVTREVHNLVYVYARGSRKSARSSRACGPNSRCQSISNHYCRV